MARINVYVPDELAAEAKGAGLNISRLTQESLRSALRTEETDAWLSSVAELPATSVSHEEALGAVSEALRDY